MAITTYRESAAPGWATTSVIYQLESAFQKLGWHAGTVSGIVTGLASYSGQSVVGTSSTDFYDARPKSGGTSIGVGDTCSFSVFRSSGSVNEVYVNRGGHGYADGDNLVIDGDDIGGGNDMTVVVQADETSYGSASTFYDKDVTVGSSAPWGVLRMEVDNTKVYGDSYWGFQANGTNLYLSSGTSFMPYRSSTVEYLSKQARYGDSFRGQIYNELIYDPNGSSNQYTNSSVNSSIDQVILPYASSNSFTLELNVFRSGLDNNFAIFSFKHPDKSSSSIDDNTYSTFFLHKYTSSLFNMDELYQGSLTYLSPTYRNMSNAYFELHTTLGNCNVGAGYYQKRSCLGGYQTGSSISNTDTEVMDRITSSAYSYETFTYMRRHLYRNNAVNSSNWRGDAHNSVDDTRFNKQPDSINYNAVIKGIPLSSQFVPCPFYLPDDFVLINFDNASPNQNIQQYDTITISGSEVYSVIDGAYNQTTRTRGILLCARTT
tara:strand:- start:239 stop:1702 length:1464 start_codon:yes stop_codon:yes gene_type:complete